MQFKHPELLYALLLLLIPIIVHLFQLRRFKKVLFTNVAFLKKATLQTRKSATIKKWLTLIFRLLALACIIFAFTQPFLASKKALNTNKETVIYLDNSFSMEAKGKEGPLLKAAINKIINNYQGEGKITLFNNTDYDKEIEYTTLKNKLLSLPFSQNQLSLNEVFLQADALFSKKDSEKKLILISDFQNVASFPRVDKNIEVYAFSTQPVSQNNLAIDTAYISNQSEQLLKLTVKISGYGKAPQQAPISLWREGQLLSKTAITFNNNNIAQIEFDIEQPEGFNGFVEIEDNGLSFDNKLYLSIPKSNAIKVLSINEEEENFLQKLFKIEAYQYTAQNIINLDYSLIPSQNFIVLNGLKNISAPLAQALLSFTTKGGKLLIIPNINIDSASYNILFKNLGFSAINEKNTTENLKITSIKFGHPLYKNVFEKQITNFQYPTVNNYYELVGTNNTVLQLENDKPFLIEKNNNYFFTGSLSKENSNFTNSPLVVPTILEMAQQSLPLANLYLEIDKQNNIAIPISIGQDEIIKLKNDTRDWIPLQTNNANFVTITTTDDPAEAGIYRLLLKDSLLCSLSYNFSRKESIIQYTPIDKWEAIKSYTNLDDIFYEITQENEITQLWKWFIIFALLFLLVEMIILKFIK